MSVENEKFESLLPLTMVSIMKKFSFGMPGQIVSFNSDTQTCEVQPVIMQKFLHEKEAVKFPIIKNVPVLFPGSGNFHITFPLEKDSYCWILFSQKSLTEWKKKGGVVDPRSKSFLDLSDAIVIPGINPEPTKLTPGVDSDAIVIRNRDNSCRIEIKNDSIKIENLNGNFVLDSTGTVSINGSNFTVDP